MIGSSILKITNFNKNSNKNFSKVNTTVHFIDVGQGDCELIVDGGKVVLIDCGEVDYGSKVVKYLKKLNIKKIDYFIGTHPHTDHIGGFLEVVKRFKIENVIMPEIPSNLIPTNPIYKKFLNFLRDNSKHIKIIKAVKGQKFNLNKGNIQILGPVKSDYDNLNDFSVVCKFVCDKCAFLFGGDAQKAAENDLIASKQNLKADVLKLNHHGSKTSNTSKFLKAVGAKICVIEVGKNNSYRHPHKNVLKSLKGVKLFRTDYDGTIVFLTDGKLIYFEKEK